MKLLFFLLITSAYRQKVEYLIKENIPYYEEAVRQQGEYIAERCMLDVYYPEKTKGFATIVWFHGGGLTGGEKSIPQELKEKGFCVVAVNYRLYPKPDKPEPKIKQLSLSDGTIHHKIQQ
jgi:carboxylesterase type B